MRILVKSNQLWNGYELLRDVDLTVENGIVFFGKRAGSYDKVFEADTVLPGLIDTHVHLTYDNRPGFFATSVSNVTKLFLAHGVLSVRDTGNYMGIDELFNSINSDLEVVTTYTVEKPPLTWMFMRMIREARDIQGAVNRAKVEGCKWFKLYNNVDVEIAKEAVVKAREAGLKITCHVTGIGLRNVVKLGFNAFEHLVSLSVLEPVSTKLSRNVLFEAWEKIDDGVVEELAKEMSGKGVFVTSTLSLLRALTGRLRIDKRKYSKYVAPWYNFYKGKKIKDYEKLYAKALRSAKILWDNKVKILCGTDIPNCSLNPGISLWEEIDVLQEAGLDFWSVLKTATGYASEALDTHIGVVKEGFKANLLLLDKEPRSVNELRINHVIIGEKIYELETLTSSLKKIPWFGF